MNIAANRVYVFDGSARQVVVLDATTHQVIAEVAAPVPILNGYSLPKPVAVSERLNRFYCPRSDQSGAIFVDVFEGSTGALRTSIPITGVRLLWEYIVVDDVRRSVYVVGGDIIAGFHQIQPPSSVLSLIKLDADRDAQTSVVRLGTDAQAGAVAIALNPTSGRVYVAGYNNLWSVDPERGMSVANLGVNAIQLLGEDRRTGKLLVVRQKYQSSCSCPNYVSVLDEASGSLTATFGESDPAMHGMITDLVTDEVTHTIYILDSGTSQNQPRLSAYDEASGFAFVQRVTDDASASNLAFDPLRRQILVGQKPTGSVHIFQTAGRPEAKSLANISTRALVGVGDDALIGGLIVTGTQQKKVLLRAIGPSLKRAGVANALADPMLELQFPDGRVVHNDDWQTTNAADLGGDQSPDISASGLAPTDPAESAMIAQLAPGAYSAIVRGKDGGTGVALVEAYDLDETAAATLANLSTRGHVYSNDDVMIGGVIVTGSVSSRVVFRALGPSLRDSAVSNPIDDPTLELHDSNGGVIVVNDDWQTNEAELNAVRLAPGDSRESAVIATLFPGSYTAVVRGKNGMTGIALVEAYRIE
ncbi:MAG: hypothetical protein M3Y69_08585 [Verrucomicrobiota bacterium]|nr:hypothetical protein [Verrucomicrobiota bacterium]